jgi:hypothetical protein
MFIYCTCVCVIPSENVDFVADVNRQGVYSNYVSSVSFARMPLLYDLLLKPFKKPLVIAKASPEQKHDALLV